MSKGKEGHNEHPDISYLKNDAVGGVLVKGLSVLFKEQPKFPVDFLAKWLLNYVETQRVEDQMKAKEIRKNKLIDKHHHELDAHAQKAQQQEAALSEIETRHQRFEDEIRQHLYHNELLLRDFPTFLANEKKLTGAYVGVLDFPLRPIDEENDEENAHLDETQPKIITYIGSTENHNFMIKKTLPLSETQGITYDVFKERVDEPPAEDENAPPKEKPPAYVYRPNVVKEEKMFFFKIPKLGAYIAVPLVFNSTLNEAAFDQAVAERIRYREDKETRLKEHQEKEANLRNAIEDAQKNGEDSAAFEEELRTMEFVDATEAPFPSIKKEYVLCCDTLGQDREILLEDRIFINRYAETFAQSWEKCEENLLSLDIDRYIAYRTTYKIDELQANWNAAEDRAADERQKSLPAELTENEVNYQVEQARCDAAKQALLTEAKEHLTLLPEYRLIKYSYILQQVLYFLGYTKSEVNIPETNILNWKKVRTMLNDEQFFNKINEYNYQGPKGDVPVYALVNRLMRKMDRFQEKPGNNQSDVDYYNAGLGRLLRWFSLVLRVRVLDIRVRRENREKLTKEREAVIAANDEAVRNKSASLEEARLAVPEGEEFNEEEWLRTYDESHPDMIKEVPPEVQEEIDADFEDENSG